MHHSFKMKKRQLSPTFPLPQRDFHTTFFLAFKWFLNAKKMEVKTIIYPQQINSKVTGFLSRKGREQNEQQVLQCSFGFFLTCTL